MTWVNRPILLSIFLIDINAAVPQGSVLGPLLFLIYINDITLGKESDIYLFADNTSIFRSGNDNQRLAAGINSDLNKITLWANRWKITINPTKTVCMLFSKKPAPDKNFIIQVNGEIIGLSDHHKHLGIWLTHNMQWKKHIHEVASKARQRLGCIQKHKYIILAVLPEVFLWVISRDTVQ